MSGGNQLALWLPLTLGALLVCGALVGGFLSVGRRAQVERLVFWPLYVVLMLVGVVLTFGQVIRL